MDARRTWLVIGAGALVGGCVALLVKRPASTTWVIGDSQACLCGGLVASPAHPSTAFQTGATSVGRVDCKFGSRVADWNKQIGLVPIAKGDRVFIFLGSNEMSASPDPSVILHSIISRGGVPVWVGPPLIRGASGTAPDFLQSAVEALGVPYLDSRTLDLQQVDGVHPTPSEAARWMQAALNYGAQ